MRAETEGIVLRQFKTVNGRRMVLLFSKKFGKISAGTSLGDRNKNRGLLALKPFTYGRYDLYKSRETVHINNAEVIKAYYKIGEDVEKYMCSSFALEFTDKLLAEDAPAPETFKLLLDFFEVIETREKKHMTPAIAFQWKAIRAAGSAPEMKACIRCGKKEGLSFFCVEEGGLVCGPCQNIVRQEREEALIFTLKSDTIEALKYFFENPLRNVRHIALSDAVSRECRRALRAYAAYHFDIGPLKSETFLEDTGLSEK